MPYPHRTGSHSSQLLLAPGTPTAAAHPPNTAPQTQPSTTRTASPSPRHHRPAADQSPPASEHHRSTHRHHPQAEAHPAFAEPHHSWHASPLHPQEQTAGPPPRTPHRHPKAECSTHPETARTIRSPQESTEIPAPPIPTRARREDAATPPNMRKATYARPETVPQSCKPHPLAAAPPAQERSYPHEPSTQRRPTHCAQRPPRSRPNAAPQAPES